MKFFQIISIIWFCSCASNQQKENKINDSLISKNKIANTPKIISDSTNTLIPKSQTLELEYIAWGCACANWITPIDRIKFDTNGLGKHCIFIEPADSTLELPDSFKYDKENIKVTGQFYIREDYPKGTIETEENLEKAKVFRYTKLSIIKKKEQLNLKIF